MIATGGRYYTISPNGRTQHRVHRSTGFKRTAALRTFEL